MNSLIYKFPAAAVACLMSLSLFSQSVLEQVVVETYYVSTAEDATTDVGGTLEEGSVTYRVFLKLSEGSQLKAVYGDEDHPFVVSSSEVFFNNDDRGETWGFEIPDNRLDENTVALDSWLSFGGATEAHWGIQLQDDIDSEVGGQFHEDGLLGALEAADGLQLTEDTSLENFFVGGDDPSAVFGEETIASEFSSSDFRAQADAIQIDETSNEFLVAQFTTKGELAFCLNFEVINPDGELIKIVGSDAVLNEGEEFSPFLKFPLQCGCTDPDYLEFDQAAACDDGSCATLIVFGCGDPLACNFDPEVNFNVQELCCVLPDNCDGLDPEIICPGVVSVEENEKALAVAIYPNPLRSNLTIEIDAFYSNNYELIISSSVGQVVLTELLSVSAGKNAFNVDMNDFQSGFYSIVVVGENEVSTHQVIVAH